MAGPKYADLMANAFSSIKAWRAATFVLAGLCGIMAMALAYNSLNAPAYLVPYEFATMKGPVKVQPGKSSVAPDYLAAVALADLALITTFHPENLSTQYSRFLNRATPELYAAQNVKLMAEARELAMEKVSQTFYGGTTRVSAAGLVVDVNGWLIRWNGDKEVLRSQVTYRLTYRESRGALSVDDVALVK